MAEINIGDRVEIPGDTQHYILKDSEKTYTGKVIGKDQGQLLVRLDEPVGRGPGAFHEVTVHETRARLKAGKD
jgi:hypothetical protein